MTTDEGEQYKLHTSAVMHEENAIRQWLNWYIACLTSVASIIGYLILNSVDLAKLARITSTPPAMMLFSICMVGVISSILTIVKVFEFTRTIESLRITYKKATLSSTVFPPITGLGSGFLAVLGLQVNLLIPLLGFYVWLVVGISVVMNFDYINSKTRHDVERLLMMEDAQFRNLSPLPRPAAPDGLDMN